MKSVRLLILAAAFVLSTALVAAAAVPATCEKKIESFDFVVDYSGSMMLQNAKLKQDKIVVAKNALKRVNAVIPALDYNGGLHTMTPNGTLLAQGPWNRAAYDAAIGKLKSGFQIFGRMTSMGDSINAFEPFISSMKRDAAVILVTDGDNNRGSDLVEVIRQVYASQRNLVVHVISLADTKNGEATVKAIAAMNPASVLVRAEELATSDAAVERFVLAVFCRDEFIVLRGVNFAFDSSELDSKAMGILNEAANIIKSRSNKRVQLAGWTDSIGTDAYNKGLSERRVSSVKSYFVKKGVPANRMSAIGKGKSFKYDNKTEEGRYMNRRTELSFN
ncbi:MAG: OmpA family protein [Candidatus Desulfovibrio kirbyi]|jgi:OOP family OmpA-OmpF porin|uniref:OmpA family protein n=1 Tax=Candidatus Desulfovibrio kirbyi TaxID=2696086 RepID=A0A6L2R4I8_9BACT|nr:OmpA family protein [Desulfovibrio sp.]GFH62372.1 MAG: OmpA family protein [Candidatus Desulfovibrio kirbyi]